MKAHKLTVRLLVAYPHSFSMLEDLPIELLRRICDFRLEL